MALFFELTLSLVFVALTVGGTIGVVTMLGWLSPTILAKDATSEEGAKDAQVEDPSRHSFPSFTPDPVFSGVESLYEITSVLEDTELPSRAERIREISRVSNHIKQVGTAMLQRKVAAMEAVNLGVGTFESGR